MSDQVTQGNKGASSNDTLRSLSEKAAAAGSDLKSKATEFATSSAEQMKGHAAEFSDKAKDVADQAGEKLQEAVAERKVAGADYVGGIAVAMRRAGREFDQELPIAGKYIRKVASQVEDVADSIRTGDVGDLVRNAQSFARRQPTAFVAIAALAGFAAVRFLKSSSSDSAGMPSRRTSDGSRSGNNVEAGYRDEFRN
jgi:ElaB/YqjD/DUF883 family membrane-anchored ribosome-binding protein